MNIPSLPVRPVIALAMGICLALGACASPGADGQAEPTGPTKESPSPTSKTSTASSDTTDKREKLNELRSASEKAGATPDEQSSNGQHNTEESKALRAIQVRERLMQINCLDNADSTLGSAPGTNNWERWPRYDGTPLIGAGYCVFIGDSSSWEMRQVTGDLTELERILSRADDERTSRACTQQYEAQPSLWVIDEKGRSYIPRWPRDECAHLQSPKPWVYFSEEITDVINSGDSHAAEVETTDR